MESKPVLLDTYSKEFLEKVKKLKKDWHKKYSDISATPTPEFDGAGNAIIKKRPDGYDYLEELYMRTKLDELFPGWSYEKGRTQFVAWEWVVVDAELCIVDEYLLAFGINPPVRRFYCVGAARIMFKSGMPHTPENIVDISNNVKSANSACLKVGINRLCRIGDDVYGKRLDEEGAGSLEDIMMSADTAPNIKRDVLLKQLEKRKMLHSKAMGILGVKSWNEVTDWATAYRKLFGESD